MGVIKYSKYTALGNNFVIVDELDQTKVDEDEKPSFARYYSDVNFGVGADDILFVQKACPEMYEEIQHYRRIQNRRPWDDETLSDLKRLEEVDAIMRIFEPDGSEASMCGNGIRCVAAYLDEKLRKKRVNILAEVSTMRPRRKRVERSIRRGYYRVNMGPLSAPPTQFVDEMLLATMVSEDNHILRLDEHELELDGSGFNIQALITYTGEPHMILFCGDTKPTFFNYGEETSTNSFARLTNNFFMLEEREQRKILTGVGDWFNSGRDPVFPEGINVNFAQVEPTKEMIKYRVFERGLNRESLACGTGATAVAAVAYHLGLVKSKTIRIEPVSGCSRQSELQNVTPDNLIVEFIEGEWYLEGPTQKVYSAGLEGRIW